MHIRIYRSRTLGPTLAGADPWGGLRVTLSVTYGSHLLNEASDRISLIQLCLFDGLEPLKYSQRAQRREKCL